MKKKKRTGLLLIGLAVICAVGGILIKSGAPEIRNALENAAYVSDGKVLAENEGKIVIVPGTLDPKLPFVDKETGITVNSIVTWRHVEKLRVSEDEEESSRYWVWDYEHNSDSFGGDKKLVCPNVTLGEFTVASDFINTLSTNSKRTEFTEKELNQMGWKVHMDGSTYYLYQGNTMPKDEEDVDQYSFPRDPYGYKQYVNTLRVSYVDRDGDLDYTIVGLQQNGQLVEAKELGLQFVCAGQLSHDVLLELADSNTASSIRVAYGLAAALLAAGIFVLVKKEKQS